MEKKERTGKDGPGDVGRDVCVRREVGRERGLDALWGVGAEWPVWNE